MPNGKYSKELMAWLEVKKRKGSRVKGERVNSITLFGSILGKEGEGLEGFRGVSTTSNPSFLIPQNWRDLEGE